MVAKNENPLGITVINGQNVYTLLGITEISKKFEPANKLSADEKPTTVDYEHINTWLTSLNIIPWGDNNMAPQEAKAKFKLNPLAMRAMKFRIDAHYGRGILLFKESADGEIIKKTPITDAPEWNEFFKRNKINMFQAKLASDWEWFRNLFIEIILSNDGKKINRVFRNPAMYCRFQKINPQTLKSEKVFMSSNWGYVQGKDQVQEIPALDWDDPIEDLRDIIKNKSKQRRFIIPVKLQETDRIYYDDPYWTPLLATWIPVSTQIAYVKQALLKNQMVLKFHIKIPYSYWSNKYAGWNDPNIYPVEKQKQLISETLDEMNTFLTDVDNYGKSFISHYGTDPLDPSLKSEEWKIEALENNLIKDGSHIVDSQAANSEIATGMGVDPALIGGQLPGGSESGSGSNKREGLAIHQATSFLDRMMTSQWFDMVKEYNEWPEEWKIGYMDLDTSQTLNENPTGKKTVV